MCKVQRINKLISRSDYSYNRFLTGVFHPKEVEEFKSKVDQTV
jgi:phosphopantetheinyl transferase (holo-ACP synthase)